MSNGLFGLDPAEMAAMLTMIAMKKKLKSSGSSKTEEEQIKQIKDFVSKSSKPCKFKPGDLVTQKTESDNLRYKIPAPGAPAMVIATKERDLSFQQGDRVSYNDLYIAVVDSVEDVEIYAVQSQFFEKYNKKK